MKSVQEGKNIPHSHKNSPLIRHEKNRGGVRGHYLTWFPSIFSNVKHLLERKSGRKGIFSAVFHITRSFLA